MDYESTPEFDAQFLKPTRKNKALEERLVKKIAHILENPAIGTFRRHKQNHAPGSHQDPHVIIKKSRAIRSNFYM
jgi:hypothetical protein